MIYSYCKRCNMESPGDTCTGCGKRAAVSAQMDQWSIACKPVTDGRIWRSALAALLAAALLLLIVVFGMEAVISGGEAAGVLFRGSLPRMILALVPIGLAITFLFLILQGQEVNVFKLDAQGAHLRTWHGPQKWKSWARLQSADPRKNVPQQDGSVVHLSQERHLLWKDVQSVQYRPAKATIAIYHTPHIAPLVLRLPPEEYELAKAYVGKYCKGK
ncbi:MAG: hypothetical protein IKH30_07395 [Clostridia bacterium]|nr:hypothetical protein [Clostridia bacterium]